MVFATVSIWVIETWAVNGLVIFASVTTTTVFVPREGKLEEPYVEVRIVNWKEIESKSVKWPAAEGDWPQKRTFFQITKSFLHQLYQIEPQI